MRQFDGLSSLYLTQGEVARTLKISLKTVQRLRRERKLKFVQFGHRTIRIPASELERIKCQ